jgi:hypothetical protein
MNALLAHKQKLTTNLSSRQIITILNALLNAVAEPLFNNCQLMRQLILQAMLQTQLDHRRKISVHSKEITAALVLHGVSQRDFSAVKLCEIDRGTLFKAVDQVYQNLLQAIAIEQQLLIKPKTTGLWLQQEAIAKYLGVDSNLLTPLARWVRIYYELYLQFKEQIIAKYIKYAYHEANRARALTGLHVDVEDLSKNYLLAVDRAIDKCDAERGTLTSYIQQWILSARSSPEFDHQLGVSYSLPANIRKDMERNKLPLTNMSTPIEEKHHEIADPDSDPTRMVYQDKVLLRCLRDLPDTKILFLLLDLPIELKQSEIDNLRGVSL